MSNLKIHKVHVGRYGDCQFVFSKDDGMRFTLPIVGRVWRRQGDGWAAYDTVVSSHQFGLLRFQSFKSRTTQPLKLTNGEVYLTLEETGRAMFLTTLPETAKETK